MASHRAGDPQATVGFDTRAMRIYGSTRSKPTGSRRTAERVAPPPDDRTAAPASVTALPDRAAASSGAGPVGSAATVDQQLRRLELLLLAEAGGDPAVEREIRQHMADACARFETATVRQFVPILVEREVRRRLRIRDRPA
jgi:hypothetical protein